MKTPASVVWLLALAVLGGVPKNLPGQAATKPDSKAAKAAAAAPAYDKTALQALSWRSIGPYRGGRSVAAVGVESQPMTYYFGGTGGGVFKTTNGGADWKPVTDGQLGTGSVGALAVAESDPNVVYVGMGEACLRGNLSHGDGVYKSVDAGKTWTKVGLEDTRHIGAVVVHPTNPDLVYVAALGHAFGANKDRGVFRSKDGGKTWEKVHFVDENTGAVDLAMDPSNPRVLFAGMYQVRRSPWGFDSGGPGSGLYKSTDGGDTWKKVEGEGLPKGPWGKMDVSVSGANPNRVYAIVEAEEGGVFRSNDGGKTWSKTNDERKLRQRAWYYTHIYADPKNADVVYVLNVQFFRSQDGGKTFKVVRTPHGDNHDLWIAKNDPNRMIGADDGGAHVSLDGGATWSRQDNQATAQFYHVITDDRFPYWVYGAQQDNSTVGIASRTSGMGIDLTDWYPVGGCESGYIAPKPGDAEHRLRGLLRRPGHALRPPHEAGARRHRVPREPHGLGRRGHEVPLPVDLPHRGLAPRSGDWSTPRGTCSSSRTSAGQSWEAISPDLTRNDASKMGPVGRPHHQGQHERRVLRHDLRLRGVAPREGPALGRLRRRPRARLPRRGQDLDERHPEGPARVEHGQPDRPLAPRRGHDVPGREPLQTRRQPALRLRHERLRQELAQDHERHPGRGFRARGAPGHGPEGPALRRHRDRASTPPSTTAPSGSPSSSTCRSCPSPTWW